MSLSNKYPLLNKLGLTIFTDGASQTTWANADELEAILQKATVVYGQTELTSTWTTINFSTDTHQALLLNPQPIKQKTTLEKISDVLEKFRETNNNLYLADEIKKLIEEANER